jgi:hypothetical protein
MMLMLQQQPLQLFDWLSFRKVEHAAGCHVVPLL